MPISIKQTQWPAYALIDDDGVLGTIDVNADGSISVCAKINFASLDDICQLAVTCQKVNRAVYELTASLHKYSTEEGEG